jgi:heat shock protein HtpX
VVPPCRSSMETTPRRSLDKKQTIDKNWSIVAWSSAGVAAVVLSYLFALGLAFACFALSIFAFGIVVKTGSFIVAALLLGIFGLVVGCTILWSLWPGREVFQPNGVPIDLAKEPRLAAEIQTVAEALAESMPTEVYLIPDANAWVTQRSGSIGKNSHRILGIGLPLLQALTVSEFRSLLAHEFAHFYSRDTRLSPWVYKAQASMARVYTKLGTRSEFWPS